MEPTYVSETSTCLEREHMRTEVALALALALALVSRCCQVAETVT
jgi:hypothetical protein